MNEQVALAALLADLEPKLRRAFLDAIQRHATLIDMRALREALLRGDVGLAMEIATVKAPALSPLAEAVRRGFIDGGMLAGRRQGGIVGRFSFDGRHPDAEAWISRQGGALITAITEESRESVRAVILDGLENSRPSAAVARDIAGTKIGSVRVGGIIGLTSPQTDSIIKARYALASGDPARMRAYLGLATRDRRFDPAIRRAIREGRAIKGPELDRILEAHKSKALKYRAEVVAKDQSRKATSAGRDQAYRQMLDLPGVTGITKRWQHNLSAEPRVDHVAMSGTVVDLEQGFLFPDGTQLRYPHDENAPAGHVIGCRCIAIYRVQVERG